MKKPYHSFFLMLVFAVASISPASAQNNDFMTDHTLIPFQNESGKWGYLDAKTDEIVVKPQYVEAELVKNGYAKVAVEPSTILPWASNELLWGWIDETGKEVIEPQFIYAEDASSTGSMDPDIITNIKVIENKKGETGLLDLTTRKWVLPPGEFEDFSFTAKHRFTADGKVLFVNGKRYKAPEGYAIDYVDYENKFFYITQGTFQKGVSTWERKIIVPARYRYITKSDSAKRFVVFRNADGEHSSGIVSPDKPREVVLYDFKGEEMARYQSTEGGFALEETYGVLDMGSDEDRYFKLTNGEEVSSAVVAGDTLEGGFQIKRKDDRYGVINAEGEAILPFEYDLITVAEGAKEKDECYFKVKKGDKEGLLSQNGEWLISLKYRFIRVDQDEIGNGWVRISRNSDEDKWDFNTEGLYNIKTDVVIPPRFSRIKIHNQVINAERIEDGSYNQLLDRKGNPITEMKYKNLQYHKGYYIGELDGKSGVLSAEGKVLVPFEYDVIFAETPDLVLAVIGGLYAPPEQKEEFYINVHTGKEYRDKE